MIKSETPYIALQPNPLQQLFSRLAACKTPIEPRIILGQIGILTSIVFRNLSFSLDVGWQTLLATTGVFQLAGQQELLLSGQSHGAGFLTDPTLMVPLSAAVVYLFSHKYLADNPILAELIAGSGAFLSGVASVGFISGDQVDGRLQTVISLFTIQSLLETLSKVGSSKVANPSFKLFCKKAQCILKHRLSQAFKSSISLGLSCSIATFTLINEKNAGEEINYPHTQIVVTAMLFVGIVWGFAAQLLSGKSPVLAATTDVFDYAFRAIYGVVTAVMSVAILNNGNILSDDPKISVETFKEYENNIIIACILLLLPAILSYIHYTYYHEGLRDIDATFNVSHLKNAIDNNVMLSKLANGLGKQVLIYILKFLAYSFYTLCWVFGRITGLGAFWQTINQKPEHVFQQWKNSENTDSHIQEMGSLVPGE